MFQSQLPSFSQKRKDDHVKYALEQQSQKKISAFEGIRFVHQSFAPLTLEQIQLTTHWADTIHQAPFYINGMTGGSVKTKQYNEALGRVAAATGLAMATGSVSGALSDDSVRDSFTIVRKVNPNGFVMANLGAHHDLENAKRAVDLLEANALQIHLNVPQEIVMPEGDRDFTSWSKNIETIVRELPVPVIVKEVGFGMSRETIQHLIQLGVKNIDVSGRGGTNFIKIENERREKLNYQAIAGWGQSTPESLLEAQPFLNQTTILASGGITDYLDIVKALALGANAVGLSGRFLQMVHEQGVEQSVEMIENWKEAIQHLMLMLNAKSVKELHQVNLILPSELRDWAEARQIEWRHFGNRQQ